MIRGHQAVSSKRHEVFENRVRDHCQEGDSTCPDHCTKYALSDPYDPDLQEQCQHDDKSSCSCKQCDEIVVCLDKLEQVIKNECTKFYSEEEQEYILYDFHWASKAINNWKAHIMRSTNQDRAKQDVLENLNCSSNFIIMDWAMKFLQMRYREKQSDWFGKRVLSWHISSVISRNASTGKL